MINISSVAATIAFPAIASCSVTKSGVDRLTRVGAMKAGRPGLGVRVNCHCPGLIPNAMGMQLAQDITADGLAPDVQTTVAGVIIQAPLRRRAKCPISPMLHRRGPAG